MGIFESECFRVTVPDGWMAFCGTDSGGKPTPKKIHIYKGISLQTDIFTHAGITACFFDKEDLYLSPKHFYDNITDIEPFTLGIHTWHGYTCTSLGYPYTMLEAKREGYLFQIMLLMKNRDHKISLSDTDVRCILASLTPTE